MGTKYILEVEDKPFELLSEDGFTSEKLFRVKGFNSLVFDWNGLNKLTPYTDPDLERVRLEAEQLGMVRAWDAARKIACYEIDGGYPVGYMLDLFNRDDIPKILSDYTAYEAIEKLKAYKQEQEEIKVGDEVENTQTGVKFIVTHLWKNNLGEQGVSGFNQECSAFSTTLGLVVKTGRAFPEIAAIFEKMRNEPNAQIDT